MPFTLREDGRTYSHLMYQVEVCWSSSASGGPAWHFRPVKVPALETRGFQRLPLSSLFEATVVLPAITAAPSPIVQSLPAPSATSSHQLLRGCWLTCLKEWWTSAASHSGSSTFASATTGPPFLLPHGPSLSARIRDFLPAPPVSPLPAASSF